MPIRLLLLPVQLHREPVIAVLRVVAKLLACRSGRSPRCPSGRRCRDRLRRARGERPAWRSPARPWRSHSRSCRSPGSGRRCSAPPPSSVSTEMLSWTFDRATTRSFHPSLSRSTILLDQPDISKVPIPSPAEAVRSTKWPLPMFRNRGKLSLYRRDPDARQARVQDIAEVRAHPRDDVAVLGERHTRVQRHLLEFLASKIVKELERGSSLATKISVKPSPS